MFGASTKYHRRCNPLKETCLDVFLPGSLWVFFVQCCTEWNLKFGLIVAVLWINTLPYSENFCDAPVGFQSGRIKNNQITASSVWNRYHAAWLARLHRARRGKYIGSWSSRHNNHNQWLQVDFRKYMKVTGIATQGRQDADQWVTAYRIYYSSDGVYFSSVKYRWNSYVKVRKKVLCTRVQRDSVLQLGIWASCS